MSFGLFGSPLFYRGGHYVSLFGLLGFAALFALGVILARVCQSSFVRRLFSRFKLDTNFISGIEIPHPQRDVYIRSGEIRMTAAPSAPEAPTRAVQG